MASVAIELKDVSVSFGAETLLENVNVRIESGEAFVVIGPSGHGKSTLLKLMGGLLDPTEGSVLFEGKDWRTMRGSDRRVAVRKMGMLFQKNALFDSLTVAENVAFPLREVVGSPETEVASTVSWFLNAVGIEHARNLLPDEISGGMQKRLGIARALALKPQTVLYDDPTAGLDPITSRKIVQLIKSLQAEMKTTLVAVTNDMNRADQMADRIGMVVDRQLIVCGTPAETRKHSDERVHQFVRGLLEGPLMVQP